MTLRFALSGATGRMGRAVLENACDQPLAFEYVGSLFDEERGFCASVCEVAQVVLDFSSPQATRTLLEKVTKPLLIGTTGHTQPLQAHHDIPVLYSPNTSPGIHLLNRLISVIMSSHTSDAHGSMDVDIVDTHHRHKRDQPSGTALRLQQNIQRFCSAHANPPKVEVHCLRSGGSLGKHEVCFGWQDESITVTHQSVSRAVYAKGALKLGGWLARQPSGSYTMEDVPCDGST